MAKQVLEQESSSSEVGYAVETTFEQEEAGEVFLLFSSETPVYDVLVELLWGSEVTGPVWIRYIDDLGFVLRTGDRDAGVSKVRVKANYPLAVEFCRNLPDGIAHDQIRSCHRYWR